MKILYLWHQAGTTNTNDNGNNAMKTTIHNSIIDHAQYAAMQSLLNPNLRVGEAVSVEYILSQHADWQSEYGHPVSGSRQLYIDSYRAQYVRWNGQSVESTAKEVAKHWFDRQKQIGNTVLPDVNRNQIANYFATMLAPNNRENLRSNLP